MSKLLAIIAAIVLAAVCSQPLMSALQSAVLPHGQRLPVMSPSEGFSSSALFALALCVCVGAAAAVVCYFRCYSIITRCTIVVLQMLLAGFLVTTTKAAQFERAVSAAGAFGMAPTFSLKQAALHTIPLAGLVAGLLAVGVAFFVRRRNG